MQKKIGKKMMKTFRPAFSPSPTGEASSDELFPTKETAPAPEKPKSKEWRPKPGDGSWRYVMFFNWSRGLQNSSRVNSFDVDRAYISYTDEVGPGANYYLTLDVARLDSTALDTGRRSQNLYNFLKTAYVDIPLPELKLLGIDAKRARIGLQPTAWAGYVEDFWWYRFVAKTMTDNEGIFQTGDFGLGLTGDVKWMLIPKVDYHATLTNGGGFRAGEVDGNKDIGVRLSANPFSIPLPGGYGGKGTVAYVTTALLGNVKGLSSNGSFGSAHIGTLAALTNWYYGNLYAEYLYGGGGSAYSVGGFYYLRSNDWAVFARQDQNDPSRVIAGDAVLRNIVGISYRWDKMLKYAVDIQTRTPEGGPTESSIFFHVYADPQMKMSY